MLNGRLNRFNNYINYLTAPRSFSPFKNKVKNIKLYHTHLFRRSYFLSRHDIKTYRYATLKTGLCFMNQSRLLPVAKFTRRNISIRYSWSTVTTVFKNQRSYNLFKEWYVYILLLFPKLNYSNFKYYWASDFFRPYIYTRSYFYTNYTRFFLNQRLVSQPVLLLYNKTTPGNLYSNYLHVYRSFFITKPTNYMKLNRGILFYVYPKFKSRSYFVRHIMSLHKFVNVSLLK